MPYTTAYNEAGYIEMIYDGVLVSVNVTPLIGEMVSIARKYNCNLILEDFREADLQLSMAAIYELPVQIFNAALQLGVSAGKFKRALIVSQKNYDKFKFLEMVSRNRVQKVKIFLDCEQAMDWLMGR